MTTKKKTSKKTLKDVEPTELEALDAHFKQLLNELRAATSRTAEILEAIDEAKGGQ